MPSIDALSEPQFQYRRKPLHIEAFQWSASRTEYDVPYWFRKVAAGGRGTMEAVRVADGLQIMTGAGTKIVHKGDWILRTRRGEISVETDESFKHTYERNLRPNKVRGWQNPEEPRPPFQSTWGEDD